MTPTPLPQRAAKPLRGMPDSVEFATRALDITPEDVATDMGSLATRVRNLMNLQQGRPFRLPLGGRFFDIVVTAAGPDAYAVVDLMDIAQHAPGHRLDACGPVIEDPQRGWLIWLVPPGTHAVWEPNRYGTCLGAPYELALPPLLQTEPPGPYWLRPCRGDRLVPHWPLADFLGRFKPGPIPHEEVLGAVLSTIS
ncbi:hypothetical protein ACH4S8_08115 [Streptomyces sp. NPDC021080]|uniref:hypothetical protein n=1 Tax=Streptomyces sp. NPDC021080 TaxID=3365110 RepID=UPI0037A4ED5E